MHSPSHAVEKSHGINRRSFLSATAAASLTATGSAYPKQASVEASNNGPRIVKIILQGGPSQIDLWDPKPNAIQSVRGDFRSISTSVSGIQVSECLPCIAKMMDHFTIVRSISGSIGSHDFTQAETGIAYPTSNPTSNPDSVTVSTAESFLDAQTMLMTGHRNIVLKFGHWDHHEQLTQTMKPIAQILDQHLSKFVQSLAATGLLQQTTILVWGEFGRSPRINSSGGRDHWPAVNSALVAGGSSSRGNVWGATSGDGGHIIDNPISMKELFQQCSQSVSACLA